MSPPWQAQPPSQAAVRSTVPVRPAAAVTGSPPEQLGPVGQRLAALADAGPTGRSHEPAPAALPLVRGRTDEPLWGGRPEPLLPDPGQVL
jgi:hypothetical protein